MRTWLTFLSMTTLLLGSAAGNATANEDICFGSGDPDAPIFRVNASSVAHTSVGDVFTLLGFVSSLDDVGHIQKKAVTGTIFLKDFDRIRLRLTIEEGVQQCDAELVANNFPAGNSWTAPECTGTITDGVRPFEIVDCVTGGIRIIP